MSSGSNFIDWAIAKVDPVRAAARARARVQLQATGAMSDALASMGGYTSTSGQDSFMRRWSTAPRDSAADTLRQLSSQRGQCRDLVRNNGIAASAINTNTVRAIGTGLAYSPQPHLPTLGWSREKAAEWRLQAIAEFSLWADSPECDWWGVQNFYDKQDLTLRSALESGDCFTLMPNGEPTAGMPYALRLQTLEADRVGNPKADLVSDAAMAGGVRRTGGKIAFHLYDRHPGAFTTQGDRFAGQWIDAVGPSGRRRMLHHYKMLRPEQPRGIPYLAPVVSLFKLLGDYTDAEVKAAVVSAFLTLVIETPTGAGVPPIFGLADAASGQAPTGGQPTPDGPSGDEMALGPAAVLGLAKGESAKVVNPLRPNPAFGAFVEAVLDQLGAGLFIGSEMLMKKYNTSYVAARAAYLDAWKHLLDMRTLIARSFCQPVLETWMAEAVIKGRISAPGFFTDPRLRWAYTRAAWRGDSPGSINPKDEVAAWLSARDGRLTTTEHASWELFGTDFNDAYPVMVSEHKQMAADGMLPAPKAGAAAPAANAAPAVAEPAHAEPPDAETGAEA
jgi:lambda family phage portal protein